MREMRRKDKEISPEETQELLRKHEVGIFTTVDQEGQPYGVPVNYVYTDSKIYFHCAKEGHKLDNIRDNNKACFTVYGGNEIIPHRFTTTFESVVAFGRAVVVEDDEKLEALRLIIERLSPGFEEEGMTYINKSGGATQVVRLDIQHMTGKRAIPPKRA